MGYQLFPDLSPSEYEALKADIAENGVLVPVEYDEDGNILAIETDRNQFADAIIQRLTRGV